MKEVINNKIFEIKWQYILLIILTGIIVYFNSLHGELHYDDYRVLNIVNIDFSMGSLRFFTWLTFYLNLILGKSNLMYYHLVNLFIHICTGITIYFIIALINTKKESNIPLFTSLLFIVHPLATEPVNYISARFAQMVTLFSLLTLLFFIFYSKTGKRGYLVLTLFSFFIGAYSKEVGVSYAVAGIFIYSIYFVDMNRFIRNRKKIIIMVLGILLLLLFLFIYTGAMGRFRRPGFFQYFLIQNNVFLLKYLRLMLLPIGLTVDHLVVKPVNCLFDFKILLSLLLNIEIILFAIVIRKQHKIVSFSIIWIYLFHIPYFFLTGRLLAVEYRVYPMILGIVLLISYCLENYIHKKTYRRILFTVIMLIFGILTISRNRVWENEITLWSSALKTNPDSVTSLNNRGKSYFQKKLYDKAIVDFSRAIKVTPNYVITYNNRGAAYLSKGLYDKAINDFLMSIEGNPREVSSYINVAILYQKKGMYNEALSVLNKAYSITNKEPAFYNILGITYVRMNKCEEAVRVFKKGLSIDPENKEIRKNLIKIQKLLNDRK